MNRLERSVARDTVSVAAVYSYVGTPLTIVSFYFKQLQLNSNILICMHR